MNQMTWKVGVYRPGGTCIWARNGLPSRTWAVSEANAYAEGWGYQIDWEKDVDAGSIDTGKVVLYVTVEKV